MIGNGWIAIVVVLALAACRPAAEPAVGARPPGPPMRTAEIAGQRPFVNEEYGVAAVFPAGSRVCEALSGEHPHGFYTRLGDERMGCRPSDDAPRASAVTVWADYNAAFYGTLEALTGPNCSNPSPAAPNDRPFAFPGRTSKACETRSANGDITVSVHAFAGSWKSEPGREAPYLIYSAYLKTTTRTEVADKSLFQRFLKQIVLTPPEPADDPVFPIPLDNAVNATGALGAERP